MVDERVNEEVNETVQVVMRTFERPVLLARALASVRGQTHQGLTLTVVNNGGEPGVVDAVVAASGLSGVNVLHLPVRTGMEAASNAALATSESEFFAIHDDDDSWHPRFLESAVAVLSGRPEAAAVVTGVVRVHETMTGSRVWPVREEQMPLDEGRLTFRGMVGHNPFPPIAALFRRRVVADVGAFDDSLPVLGDWEFNLRAVTTGPFVFIPDVLARYHTRTPESDVGTGNSITAGVDLHRSTKRLLQDRWLAEPPVNGANKGELSVQAEAALEAEETRLRVEASTQAEIDRRVAEIAAQRGLLRRILGVIANPSRGVVAVRRRLGR
ncbi:MAG: glycosyltransferase family 2 protein [Actinomycetota bacterium]